MQFAFKGSAKRRLRNYSAHFSVSEIPNKCQERRGASIFAALAVQHGALRCKTHTRAVPKVYDCLKLNQWLMALIHPVHLLHLFLSGYPNGRNAN
jgi:hypothetical protein